MKLIINLPDATLEVDVHNEKEVFKATAFWNNMPRVCPLDGSPTRLNHRVARDFDFYELISTGPTQFRFGFGQHKEGGGLFPQDKEGWQYYDPTTKENITVWQYGNIICENLPRGFVVPDHLKGNGAPAPRTNNGNGQAQRSEPRAEQPPVADTSGLETHQKWVLGLAAQHGIPADSILTVAASAIQGRPWASIKQLERADASALLAKIKGEDGILERIYAEQVNAANDQFTDDEFPADEDLPF